MILKQQNSYRSPDIFDFHYFRMSSNKRKKRIIISDFFYPNKQPNDLCKSDLDIAGDSFC